MTRPSIAPALAARLLAAAPARLRRRLDQDPRLAADWTWADDGAVCTVTVDHDTRVALHGPVLADEAQIRCSCLLSPRCLHVLACLTMLAPAETEPAVTPAPAATDAGPVGADRCAAAEHALEAVGLLLATGATAAGTVVQAELLRALHGARTAGCHRLGAGLGRLLGGVRRLRDGVPGADAADTLADAGEACAAALGLLAPGATAADAGSARRAYEPVGNLRLVGLCSEPVATRGGWAGVATWLADAHGRLWSLSDVQPGGVERVLQAWRGGVRLGDLSLAHAELVRAGALVQDATASADGRLGAGAAVQAVRAAGATWDQPPLASLFARPLADQVATALAPGSAGLLTLAGRLVGGCLRLEGGHRLGLVPALADPALPALANLRALAAADLAVRAVVRPLREAAGQAALLALAPADDGLRLPEAMAGRLMAALEHLPHAGLANGQGGPAADEDPPLPWATLERRALAVLLGGRSALPASVGPGLAAEARNLRAQLCGAAAARLESLFQACQAVPGERWGRLAQVPPAAFARQWAAAALQAQRAREQHARDAWTRWADPASC